jgi:hypothetical protein
MTPRDEEIRDRLTDALTAAGIDARNLAVEVRDGRTTVSGTVPTEDQRRRLVALMARRGGPGARCSVELLAALPPDSADGRGRSPVTGTSADSAHESRHQEDRK